jgi:lycopene cyclase domain-containing protein
MMTLTAVFDNAIIGTGLVAYDSELLSGVMVGLAPIEDFAYTLAALMMIPALWHLLEPRAAESS